MTGYLRGDPLMRVSYEGKEDDRYRRNNQRDPSARVQSSAICDRQHVCVKATLCFHDWLHQMRHHMTEHSLITPEPELLLADMLHRVYGANASKDDSGRSSDSTQRSSISRTTGDPRCSPRRRDGQGVDQMPNTKTQELSNSGAVAVQPAPSTTTKRRAISDTTADGRPVMEVWESYRDNPDEETRNVLVEHYLRIVRYTAERLHARLPSEVDVDDLMSSGLFGLVDAIEAFDLERGVKFETYCTQRIRGAIFDELRAMDWVPRLVRSRTAKMDRARKEIEMTTGRLATEQEVTAHLNVSSDEFEKIKRDSRPVSMVSLNRKWYETDSSRDVTEVDVVRDRRQESPVSKLQREDLKYLLTRGLSRAERLIVILYYYEEMTMKEIGVTLDLSESRVSQMHSSILARLKAQMQHRTKDV